jgi:UDP-N-acetyl-D-mannosaminuronic acid dehydrogenase
MVYKIRAKKGRISVIGLGYVGLPTAAIFADAGFKVVGVDVNPQLIQKISSGESLIKEPGLSRMIERGIRRGLLKLTTKDLQACRESDVIIVCVQTPLAEDKRPDLTYLRRACKAIGRGLSKRKVVIIESTLPPTATRDIIAPILEKESGLKCGVDFWLAYCPERLAPGNALNEFLKNSRIVGGYNKESAKIAAELYRTVIKGKILVTDSTTAETAKLAENTFRDVNIGFANELAMVCERVGIDVMEVINLANTHPRVSIHKPGCGVGGPCLPKDPYMLLHPEKDYKSIIEPSRKLNNSMPEYVVGIIAEALEKVGKKVKNSKIAVLGTAYKAEVDDARNSPVERIIGKLRSMEAQVVVYDPYCKENFGARKAKGIMEATERADCIVLATDHKVFTKLELGKIKRLMKGNIIVDGRRILNPKEAEKEGFVYFGIGYSSKNKKAV